MQRISAEMDRKAAAVAHAWDQLERVALTAGITFDRPEPTPAQGLRLAEANADFEACQAAAEAFKSAVCLCENQAIFEGFPEDGPHRKSLLEMQALADKALAVFAKEED